MRILLISALSPLVIHSFTIFFCYSPSNGQGPGGPSMTDKCPLALSSTSQPTELREAFHSIRDTVSGWPLEMNAYESH